MKSLIFLLLICSFLRGQLTMSPFSDTIFINEINPFLADSLFSLSIAQLAFLDYNDCNNCALRAHVMSFVFLKQFPGIKTAKVWLFADSKLSSRRDYYKTHEKRFLKGNIECPQWGFHVAPVLLLENDTIVIDPSTQKNPVKINKWIKDISINVSSFIVFKKSVYYSYPEDEHNLFDNTRQEWNLKYNFSSLQNEVNFLAHKLTLAYHLVFDPLKFNYFKNMISKSITK